MNKGEALANVKRWRDALTGSGFNSYSHLLTPKDNKTLDVVAAALEKQIPKQVVLSGDGYADGVIVMDMANCPSCNHSFDDYADDWRSDYCPKCGQALKWDGAAE